MADIPKCSLDAWISIPYNSTVLRLVARISARVFVGLPLCRNEEWLRTSISYSQNVFITSVIIRLFPTFMQSWVAPFIPAVWKVQQNLRLAKSLIVPYVEKRIDRQCNDPNYRKPDDLLQWMMNEANEQDGKPEKLAHRELVITLASIHTSTMAAVHTFYDICAHPEYIQPLREEVIHCVKEEGGWSRAAFGKMMKMDSFMKESQRVNPPSLCMYTASRVYSENQVSVDRAITSVLQSCCSNSIHPI